MLVNIRPEYALTTNDQRLLLIALRYAQANEDDVLETFGGTTNSSPSVDGLPVSIPVDAFSSLADKLGLNP